MSQVLAGLLGRYVKGIQKEQLKIGIWNGGSSIPSPPSLPPLRPIINAQTGGCLNPAALQFVPVLLPQHLFWKLCDCIWCFTCSGFHTLSQFTV